MHLRKRSTIAVVAFAVSLFVFGLFVDFQATSQKGFRVRLSSESFDLKPLSEESRNATADEPNSILSIQLESDAKLQVYIEFNGSRQYSEYESHLNHNFLLPGKGEWTVRFINSNSEGVLHVSCSIDLTVFYTQAERPYAWLRIPTLFSGFVALSLIIPINFYDTIKKKWNRTITEILIFSVLAIVVVGTIPMLSVVLGTRNPLVYTNTPSMEPTIWPGDLAIVAGANPKDLAGGDIILYDIMVQDLNNPQGEAMSIPIMHRINGIVAMNGSRYFITKGDNNPTADDWYVPETGVIGKVIYIIPYLGNIIGMKLEFKILILALVIVVIILWPHKKTGTTKPEGEKR